MKMRDRFSFLRNDDGFTLFEIMIALVIISVLGVVIWQGFTRGSSLIEKISLNSLETINVIHTENSIRSITGEIQIPFWVTELLIEENDSTLTIPYYEGERDRTLTINSENNSLVFHINNKKNDNPADKKAFGPFSNVYFALAKNETGEIFGIKYVLKHQKKSFDTITIIAGFGSNPFWKIEQ
jgi:prepilin-type N-terminal cleavage/methylation domain-containing protein